MSIQPHKLAVGNREDLFVIRDFLSPEQCAQIISSCEDRGFEAATISTAVGPVRAAEIRNNDRLITDDPLLAEQWWQRASMFFPSSFGRWRACGLNERFRCYRYGPGQKFAKHRDGSFERHANEMSWMTFMVYLNEGYLGGRTRFELAGEPQPVLIEPHCGSALAFMHDRLHEGEAVVSGIKYVLRTDVMYRRN